MVDDIVPLQPCAAQARRGIRHRGAIDEDHRHAHRDHRPHGVGALVARPFLTGGAADLKVGECFEPPTTVGETVDEVQHHPCTDAHGGEVFFVGDVAAADGAPYPTDAALETEVQALCTPAFDAYTGLDFVTDPDWTYGYLSPTTESWADNDRGIICYAARLDGATTTTSIKAAS